MAIGVFPETGTSSIPEAIKDYYGKVLQSPDDLQMSACCAAETPPQHIRDALKHHEEVQDRFYGCGSPIPAALEGITVLDLGCGSGRDCYVVSKLVGSKGQVIGVDMTDEQVTGGQAACGLPRGEVRLRQRGVQAWVHRGPSVHRHSRRLRGPGRLQLRAESVARQAACLRGGHAGAEAVGELHFSDVFADRRIPTELMEDPVLLGECLSGALYVEDFRRVMAESGSADTRVVCSSPLEISNPEIARKIGFVTFSSLTVRVFKLPLEDRCEDYGQIAVYRGTLPEHPHSFDLDDHHRFHTGKPEPVCGNTADILSRSRYGAHFEVIGDKSTHFGLVPCGPSDQSAVGRSQAGSSGCC